MDLGDPVGNEGFELFYMLQIIYIQERSLSLSKRLCQRGQT